MAEYGLPDTSSSSDDEKSLADDDKDLVDAFPSRIYDLDDLEEFTELFQWSAKMESIKISKAEAIPVIPFKEKYEFYDYRLSERIHFFNLEKDRAILSDRFDRLYDNACEKLLCTGHVDVEWTKLDSKLQKNPRLSHRVFRNRTNKSDGQNRKGNADNRQSFVLRNMFLVKGHVTPGARTTGPDEYHLFQIYNVPLMLYIQTKGGRVKDRSFLASTKDCYKAFLLQPGHTYFVRPCITYISMSLQKTCYAVTRVTTALITELLNRFRIKEATEHVFKELSKEELTTLIATAGNVKRKRGRPSKSLDSIYWNPPASTTTASKTKSVAKVKPHQKRIRAEDPPPAADTTTDNNTPFVPLEEIDQFIGPDVDEAEYANLINSLGSSMPVC